MKNILAKKVSVTRLAMIVVLVGAVSATANTTDVILEYKAEEKSLSNLQYSAEMIAGDSNWYDPESALWSDGQVDKKFVAQMVAREQFADDDVFSTPEWKKYEEITQEQAEQVQNRKMDSYKNELRSISFPNLRKEAYQAYETIETAMSEQANPYKKTVLLEAENILLSSGTKEKALEKASEWDLSLPSDGENMPLDAESLQVVWGISDPSEENRLIARDAIRLALNVAISEDYVTL